MRKIYLLLFLLGTMQCLAQNATDTIYQVNRAKFAAIVDEVSAVEIAYFLPEDVSRAKKIRMAREKVWKVIYCNGETEEFNPAKTLTPQREQGLPPAQEKPQAARPATNGPVDIELKADTIKAGKIAKTPESTLFKPNEIIIKIQHEQAPDNANKEPRREYKNYVGIRVGGSMTSFYTDKVTFPKKPFYNWEAGLGFSLVNTRHYNARLELMYANKGSRETFSNQFTEITSRSKMTYGQANLLPFILKSGARKLNPAIGVGGYYAYRIKHVSEIKEDDGAYFEDELTQELLEGTKSDYGALVMLAFYSGDKPLLEFRYEHGLAELMKGLKVKNNGLSVSLFLKF